MAENNATTNTDDKRQAADDTLTSLAIMSLGMIQDLTDRLTVEDKDAIESTWGDSIENIGKKIHASLAYIHNYIELT